MAHVLGHLIKGGMALMICLTRAWKAFVVIYTYIHIAGYTTMLFRVVEDVDNFKGEIHPRSLFRALTKCLLFLHDTPAHPIQSNPRSNSTSLDFIYSKPYCICDSTHV